MERISILIADDHPMVRMGIKNLLETQKNFSVVGEASDGEEALREIERTRPMIAILDISMPKLNGIKTAKIVAKKFPETKVVVLTMYEDEAYMGKAMEAGAHGYLLKDAKGEEIIKALKRVAAGEKYFSDHMLELIGKQFSQKHKPGATEDQEALASLTSREKEILLLIAEGQNSQEIAKKLFLSPRTVDTHRANLMHKLRIHNATALVRFAMDNGLVSPKPLT